MKIDFVDKKQMGEKLYKEYIFKTIWMPTYRAAITGYGFRTDLNNIVQKASQVADETVKALEND